MKQEKTLDEQTARYAQFVRSLDLADLKLKSVSASFDHDKLAGFEKEPPPAPGVGVNIGLELAAVRTFSDFFDTISKLAVTFSAAKDGGGEDVFGSINIEFQAKFSSKNADQELADRFAKTNLKVIVWPYFREFVYSLTGRFGVPPLLIPIHAPKIEEKPKTKSE
jgi:preprotein translocase subunit SecB